MPRGERRFKFKICSVWLDADGFAALAAAEAVKIERNSRGGDSGDERR